MAGYQPQNQGNKSTNRVGATMSRKLRAAGWNISPSARKYKHNGIFVSAQGDHVSIMVNTNLATKDWRVAKEMAAEIGQWDCLSDVRVREADGSGCVFIFATYVR